METTAPPPSEHDSMIFQAKAHPHTRFATETAVAKLSNEPFIQTQCQVP